MSECIIRDHRREQQKSFDMASSVTLMRYDIENVGRVLPETSRRVFDEQMTYLAEGVNRSLYTKFVLNSENDTLVFFDRGEWRPYVGTLIRGLEVAKSEAATDYRRSFLVEKSENDLLIGYALQNLSPGLSFRWSSPYPQQQEELYGEDFIREIGFQPRRKMGFLYQATKNEDGSVTLESQSVDNSDDDAFNAALNILQSSPNATIEDMRKAYDGALKEKHGGHYFAGRRIGVGEQNEDAWEVIQRHGDLLTYFMSSIEAIAYEKNVNNEQVEARMKTLTYGVWAALKQRLDTARLPLQQERSVGYSPAFIQLEVQRAFTEYSIRGEVLVGCGGAIKGLRDGLLNSDPSDVFNDIFGEASADKWTWKKGVCRVDKCPTRPGQTEVGPCDVCRNCQHWFDKGRNPEKLYQGLKLATKDAVTTQKTKSTTSTTIKKKEKVTA